MRLSIKIAQDCELFKITEIIRRKVFVDEQGFAAEIEVDETDKYAFHVAAFDGEIPVGAARFFGDKDPYHVGRVAVLPEYRGKGIGEFIMREIEKFAREIGVRELSLSSQMRVVGFYDKCGYSQIGEEYLDEGCPHIEMRKNISL